MKNTIKKFFLVILMIFSLFLGFIFLSISTSEETAKTEALAVFFCCMFLAIVLLLCIVKPREAKRKRDAEKLNSLHRQRIAQISQITVLPVIPIPDALLLRENEICHFQSNASVIQIKERVVGYTGGSGGVSVRVAKGITLHSGRSRGTPIRQDIEKAFPGIFTMTNQRIVMTGEKGFEYSLSRFTSVTPWNGYRGAILQFGNISKILEMPEPYWIPKILDLLKANAM